MTQVSTAQRIRLAQVMDYLVARADRIHYPAHDRRTEQIHGIATMAQLTAEIDRTQGLVMDCSQAVELVCHVAGIADPDQDHYLADGFTGTLLRTQPHYTHPSGAGIGAIVIFGPGTGEHACLVRHRGSDPVLFSHGQEAGPLYVPLSVESRTHHPPVTFVSIVGLGRPAT